MKHLIYILTMLPALWVIPDVLSAIDPYDIALEQTGTWMIIWLSIVLLIGPVGRFLKNLKASWAKQPLGLGVFTWTILHILSYFVFHQQISLAILDLVSKPFLVIALPASILIMLLGITSSQSMMKLLGRKWNTLHSSVVIAASLGAAHAAVSQKTIYTDVGITILILIGAIIMRYKLEFWRTKR